MSKSQIGTIIARHPTDPRQRVLFEVFPNAQGGLDITPYGEVPLEEVLPRLRARGGDTFHIDSPLGLEAYTVHQTPPADESVPDPRQPHRPPAVLRLAR